MLLSRVYIRDASLVLLLLLRRVFDLRHFTCAVHATQNNIFPETLYLCCSWPQKSVHIKDGSLKLCMLLCRVPISETIHLCCVCSWVGWFHSRWFICVVHNTKKDVKIRDGPLVLCMLLSRVFLFKTIYMCCTYYQEGCKHQRRSTGAVHATKMSVHIRDNLLVLNMLLVRGFISEPVRLCCVYL